MPNTESATGLSRFINAATMAAPRATARSGSPAPSATRLAAGVVVDNRYELVRELGRGAMGVVWEARHRVLTKHVALKFLHPQLGLSGQESVLLDRFRYEAQVSARLAVHTRHIVAVHDTAVFGDRHYIVMDLASGHSVESEIDAGPMSLAMTAVLLRQVGDALRVAHRADIVHRDVKPSNILMLEGTDSGEPMFKLADFGVAKAFGSSPYSAGRTSRTVSGLSLGSPAYMSPEQIQGAPTVDGDPDRWALAAVAYEAMAQQLPFDGATLGQLAKNIMDVRYTAISEIVPNLPLGIDAFFAKAFARSKADRFESIEAMLEAFSAASGIATAGVRAPTPVPPEMRETCVALSGDPPSSMMTSSRAHALVLPSLRSAGPQAAAPRSNRPAWLRFAVALPVALVILFASVMGLRTAPLLGSAADTQIDPSPSPAARSRAASPGAFVEASVPASSGTRRAAPVGVQPEETQPSGLAKRAPSAAAPRQVDAVESGTEPTAPQSERRRSRAVSASEVY